MLVLKILPFSFFAVDRVTILNMNSPTVDIIPCGKVNPLMRAFDACTGSAKGN